MVPTTGVRIPLLVTAQSTQINLNWRNSAKLKADHPLVENLKYCHTIVWTPWDHESELLLGSWIFEVDMTFLAFYKMFY